jgi:uncharacterized membrane protein YdbT with pleckstrin-like domain
LTWVHNDMIHYSKKDSWFIGVALSSMVIPLALGLFFFLSNSTNRPAGYWLVVSGIVIGVLVLCLTYPLYYEITSSELTVRCGILLRWHIPLAAISEVQPE